MSVIIDKDQCMGCGNCLNNCPLNLLELTSNDDLNKRNVRYVYLKDVSSCVECGKCELMCTAAALHIEKNKDSYNLLDKEHIPPHSGCYLGSLAKALANAIEELNIKDNIVLFKKKSADVNLHVESYDYTDDNYYIDGLNYKKEHPDKIVLIISNSSKIHSTALNEERYRQLKDEKITLINTLNWFECDENISVHTAGDSHILEELAKNSNASFIARGGVRSPEEIRKLQAFIKQGLQNQIDNKNFSVIEMVFPCFYRLAGRPQVLMPYEKISEINSWFDKNIKNNYPLGIMKGGK